MSNEGFTLKIFTPVGLVLESRVSSVTLPTQNGEIGALAGHAKYTGLLGSGVLRYQSDSDNTSKQLAISEGFCTFADNVMTILADFVAAPEEIKGESYAKDRDGLQKSVDTLSIFDPEWQIAKEKLARIQAIDSVRK